MCFCLHITIIAHKIVHLSEFSKHPPVAGYAHFKRLPYCVDSGALQYVCKLISSLDASAKRNSRHWYVHPRAVLETDMATCSTLLDFGQV